MIPLVDLKAQYSSVKPDIDAAIAHVLETAQFALGPAVEAFEREFATYCTTTEAVAVNTGTSALHVALLAVGVRPGDEVITVPFTFVATVAAIEHAGATPVFVDIDPDYHTMDPSALERAITPRTRAVMPVHLFGQPADMDPIADVARRHKLAVIEDACQAHGADYKGRRTGSIGDIGCFSFYPGKNLGAYGEGGAAVTSYQPYADKMRLLRSWGEKTRYEHSIRGFNYRMDGIQGAVLGVKLRHLERWTKRGAGWQRPTADVSPVPGREHRWSVLAYGMSITSTRCGCRGGTRGVPVFARWGSRRACTIRFPCTFSLRIATSDTRQEISRSRKRSRARFCRCRCSLK